ncbi:hypothetical protein D3C71_2121180 [compost metagenome]
MDVVFGLGAVEVLLVVVGDDAGFGLLNVSLCCVQLLLSEEKLSSFKVLLAGFATSISR